MLIEIDGITLATGGREFLRTDIPVRGVQRLGCLSSDLRECFAVPCRHNKMKYLDMSLDATKKFLDVWLINWPFQAIVQHQAFPKPFAVLRFSNFARAFSSVITDSWAIVESKGLFAQKDAKDLKNCQSIVEGRKSGELLSALLVLHEFCNLCEHITEFGEFAA